MEINRVKDLKKGDKLWLVYIAPDETYKIGEAVVSGFHDGECPVGDRWETWEERSMTNIDYEFEGIKFSRDTESILENSHFTDKIDIIKNPEYTNIMSNGIIQVFTSKEEAKEYVLKTLRKYMLYASNEIKKAQEKMEFYRKNCADINEKN